MNIFGVVAAQVAIVWNALMLRYWEWVAMSQRIAIGEVDYEHSQKVRGYQVALELSKLRLNEVLS